VITLRTLRWDNCFSYGKDNTLYLDDCTLTQLIGTNGMGKSSVPLILEEVFFNKNSKGIKKKEIQNRFINKGYWINIKFDVDENNYELDVTRKAGIKCKLYENGKDISSRKFAELLKEKEISGKNICFVIGGAYGLGENILERANLKLSLSKVTFPYKLARLILLEQIYRAYCTNKGINYQK